MKPLDLPALRSRALRVLNENRTAGLNFPGIFMGVRGRKEGRSGLRLEFEDGPLFRDSAGEVSMAAFGVLIDTACGAVTRTHVPPTMRPATVHLKAQFTGAPAIGHIVSHTRFQGHSDRAAVTEAVSVGRVMSGTTLLAHVSGTFLMLNLPEGRMHHTNPWLPARHRLAPELDESDLQPHEAAVIDSFDESTRKANTKHPFIEYFWGGEPKIGDGKAKLRIAVAPHLGNRVGDVHGGILFGLAAQVAASVVPDTMRLSNICAWFTSPGKGPHLDIISTVVQQGRTLAVVRTQILNSTGVPVLEVTSQHLRCK
jgi:acyl-coenzyme A thioesterase PaaI-like protein